MELAIGQLIKIIIGVLVVVAVIVGIGIIFKEQVIDFFRGLSVGNLSEVSGALL
jgi:hypothetical protein